MAGYLPIQEGVVGTSHGYSIPANPDFFNGLLGGGRARCLVTGGTGEAGIEAG
jgi:hypothetical protein